MTKQEKKTMTEQLIEQLERRGLHPVAEVRTAAGVADIVTGKAVYEVVPELTAEALRKAITRATAYRDALGDGYKAVIYGRRGAEDVTDLEHEARSLGITINYWQDGDRPGMN